MHHSKLAAIALATIALIAPQIASATIVSTSAQACRLTSTASPYNELSTGAAFYDGKFQNRSGANALAMCPVARLDGDLNFWVATSSTTATCYLRVTSITGGGGTTLIYGTRSGNNVTFSTTTGAQYAGAIQCSMANNDYIWGLLTY